MQVVGFNLNKISGHRIEDFKHGPMNLNIEFTDMKKLKLDLLKDSEAAKFIFKFSIDYFESEDKRGPKDQKLAEINIDGHIRLSLTKDELKDVTKSWKKKQIPNGLRIALNNLILKKTAPKALQLQDELGIPSHLPIQQIKPSNQ